MVASKNRTAYRRAPQRSPHRSIFFHSRRRALGRARMAYRVTALRDSTRRRMGWVDRCIFRGPLYGVLLAVSALRPRPVRCRSGHAVWSLGHDACLGSASSGSFAFADQFVAPDSRAFRAQSETSLVDFAPHASLGEPARRIRFGSRSLSLVPCGRVDRKCPGTLSTKLAPPLDFGFHTLARSAHRALEPQRPAYVHLPDIYV